MYVCTGPDSANGIASNRERAVVGSIPGRPRHTKGVKNDTSG